MTDEKDVYRQRKKINPADLTENGEPNPLANVQQIQEAVARETGREAPTPFKTSDVPFQVGGNIPPQFAQALQQAKTGNEMDSPQNAPRPAQARATPDSQIRVTGSDKLEEALQKLAGDVYWEEFEWPSAGRFYKDIPNKIHIRPMTGEEEQILATPRWVKSGKAIDKIFERCIRENIPTDKLLSVDRTHLLIFLRGISYTPEYDVEIKCPECGMKFSDVIDLNTLEVDYCPDYFTPESLEGVLPKSGFSYKFRLPTGADEMLISRYRENKIAKWGEQSEDDTLLYRTAMLIEDIEGIQITKEIQILIKKLPMEDVSHLRNEITDLPFGVDTEIPLICPACSEEFKIDLPLEANFFFPRKKETRAQA